MSFSFPPVFRYAAELSVMFRYFHYLTGVYVLTYLTVTKRQFGFNGLSFLVSLDVKINPRFSEGKKRGAVKWDIYEKAF